MLFVILEYVKDDIENGGRKGCLWNYCG